MVTSKILFYNFDFEYKNKRYYLNINILVIDINNV